MLITRTSLPFFFFFFFFFPVPTPTLTITGSPRDSHFFQGLILMFTCLVEIDSSVDTDVTVEASWERNGTLLEDSSDRRITVISTGLVESPYQTGVRFNATDFEDAGRYNCSARIIPRMSEFILEQTGFVTRAITVLSKYSMYCKYMYVHSCSCFNSVVCTYMLQIFHLRMLVLLMKGCPLLDTLAILLFVLLTGRYISIQHLL